MKNEEVTTSEEATENNGVQNPGDKVAENKMGVMPENKLLLSMSAPMMVSMLVQALYNIVDSLFVARISEDALSAVSLAFPMQTIMIALAGGTCVGFGTMLSKALGEKRYKRVSNIANHGIFLTFIIYILFLLMGLFLVRPFFEAQTDNKDIVEYGVQYLTIVCCCSMGICMQLLFEKLLQSTGRTFYTMITQMTGAVINLILDPMFIFGFGIIPKCGVAGAAIATVIGQIVAGILALYLNVKKNPEVKFSLKGFRPSGLMVGRIYQIAGPSVIMQSIGSIMVFGMNQILMAFSSTATAVFGVYFKLQSFIFMPVFGLNNGLVPIVAYNFGAQKKSRLLKIVKLGMIYASSLMLVGFAVFQICPELLLKMFEASDKMMSIGVPALRIISVHFLLAGVDIIGISTCQALGNAVYSMFVSIIRQLVALLPIAFFLSKLGNVDYVWWSFPLAEVVALVMTMLFLRKTYRDLIKPLPDKA